MRKMLWLAVWALAWPASAQDVNGLKTVAPKAKAAKMVKSTAKRHQDARHCLQRATNDAIIRCAEDYL